MTILDTILLLIVNAGIFCIGYMFGFKSCEAGKHAEEKTTHF